jgi:hypothetical protein
MWQLNKDDGCKENEILSVQKYGSYLLPPLFSLRMTSNLPNQGNTMYLMYSKQGFPSTILGGQKACFIFTLTCACNNKVIYETIFA